MPTKPSIENVQVDLPLPATVTDETMIKTCNAQSAVIKACPLYATTQPVEDAVTAMDTAVNALSTTLAQMSQVHAQLVTLETTRNAQIVTVRLKHGGVETALNTASNGNPQVAQQWTGKTKSRTRAATTGPVPLTAPEGCALRNIKKHSGTVEASCTQESGVVCYAFQQGTDPLHPETWPPPAMVSGHTFKVGNLPIGQVVCFRIAVIRRGSVQGAWSSVMQITVR